MAYIVYGILTWAVIMYQEMKLEHTCGVHVEVTKMTIG
jgi:hypothetical protein